MNDTTNGALCGVQYGQRENGMLTGENKAGLTLDGMSGDEMGAVKGLEVAERNVDVEGVVFWLFIVSD